MVVSCQAAFNSWKGHQSRRIGWVSTHRTVSRLNNTATSSPRERESYLQITVLRATLMGVFAFVLSTIAHAAMVSVPGDPVQTASGLVAGTEVQSGVKAYLGVPYAKP